jgi:hypothetical protein
VYAVPLKTRLFGGWARAPSSWKKPPTSAGWQARADERFRPRRAGQKCSVRTQNDIRPAGQWWRKSAATYFTKGHLYILEAVVLPANGDFTTPDAGRFLDSLAFDLNHTEPGASELPIPK